MDAISICSGECFDLGIFGPPPYSSLLLPFTPLPPRSTINVTNVAAYRKAMMADILCFSVNQPSCHVIVSLSVSLYQIFRKLTFKLQNAIIISYVLYAAFLTSLVCLWLRHDNWPCSQRRLSWLCFPFLSYLRKNDDDGNWEKITALGFVSMVPIKLLQCYRQVQLTSLIQCQWVGNGRGRKGTVCLDRAAAERIAQQLAKVVHSDAMDCYIQKPKQHTLILPRHKITQNTLKSILYQRSILWIAWLFHD